MNYKIFFFLIVFSISKILSEDFYEYKYKIYWKGIPVGYANIGKYGIVEHNSKKCYLLKSTAYNLPILQKIYPVKDRVISYWDINKKIPHYSEKELMEGSYYRFQRSYFYYDLKQIHWYQKEKGSKGWKNKNDILYLQSSEIQDILTSIFYLKENPQRPYKNAKFQIPLFDDTKLTFLTIWILDKEIIKLNINNTDKIIESWIVKPFYETSGLFRLAGDLTIWIDDKEKNILKVKAKIPYIGYIETLLVEKEKF